MRQKSTSHYREQPVVRSSFRNSLAKEAHFPVPFEQQKQQNRIDNLARICPLLPASTKRLRDEDTHPYTHVPLIFLWRPPLPRDRAPLSRKFRYSKCRSKVLAAGWTCCCWYWCSAVLSACRNRPQCQLSVRKCVGTKTPTADSSSDRRRRLRRRHRQHMGVACAPASTFRWPTFHRPEWSWSAATTTVAIRCSKGPWPGMGRTHGQTESNSCFFESNAGESNCVWVRAPMRSKSRQQKWSCAERGQQLSAAEFDPFAECAAAFWVLGGLTFGVCGSRDDFSLIFVLAVDFQNIAKFWVKGRFLQLDC